jgi:PBSX family phage terminase large subunit
MATTETQEPREVSPFTEQRPFLKTDKKYYGYISGVGAGKTFAGIVRTILNMTEWNPGEMGAIVAPTRQMVINVIIPEMRQLGLFDAPINWEHKSAHSDEPGIHAPNGSRALILSADNKKTIERLRGLNLAWFWIDEEAKVPPRAREILTQRIRVGQYRNGYITTTPEGKNHTYDFFVGDQEGEYQQHGDADIYECDDRLALLRVPSHANPHNPEDYIQGLEKDHEGQRYEQEVLGDFVQFEGLVYRWFNDDNQIKHSYLPREWDETVYGIDWGGTSPSVILAFRILDDVWYLAEEYYQRRVTVNDMVAELERMEELHGPGVIYCDSAEPGSIEILNRNGFNAQSATKDVDSGLRHVAGKRDELIVASSCQNTINEFNQYRYKDDSDAVLKENDHAMDALRYAMFTHEQEQSDLLLGFD